jgi:hypothetical protein
MLLATTTPLQRGAGTLFDVILVVGVALIVFLFVGGMLWLGFSSLRSAIKLTSGKVQIAAFGIPAVVAILGAVGSGANLGIAVLISVVVGGIFWLSSMDWSGY